MNTLDYFTLIERLDNELIFGYLPYDFYISTYPVVFTNRPTLLKSDEARDQALYKPVWIEAISDWQLLAPCRQWRLSASEQSKSYTRKSAFVAFFCCKSQSPISQGQAELRQIQLLSL